MPERPAGLAGRGGRETVFSVRRLRIVRGQRHGRSSDQGGSFDAVAGGEGADGAHDGIIAPHMGARIV